MDFINLPILIVSLLLGISILTSLITMRVGIPLILVFLCIGLLAGDAGLSLVQTVRHPRLSFFVGSLALAIILFDSGFHTQTKGYRNIFMPSFLLATVGVILTAVFLAPVAKEVMLIGWLPALLLASIISSTDSASVFFLLRSQGISLREKVKATLEVESGANDPMAIFLTMACITLVMQQTNHEAVRYGALLPLFAKQLLIGLSAGFFLGWLLTAAVNKVKLEHALYPIFVVSIAMMGFAVTNMLQGSGFLAVYIAGLILGNSKIQGHTQISKFQQTLTWLSQIVMFITLGLYVSADTLRDAVLPGFLIGVALVFFARPLAIWLVLMFFPMYTAREKIFISFVGLRGATSILLALAPIVYGLSFGRDFLDVIFVMVLFSLAFQGFLIPVIAKWCGLEVPVLCRPPEKTEIDLPGLTDSSLIAYELHQDTPAVKGEDIPKWARPNLIIRGGISYTPTSIRQFKEGDRVYVFSSSEAREPLLDHLYGGGDIQGADDVLGDFPIAPTTTFSELEKMYGIEFDPRFKDMTIANLLKQEFNDFEVGDRLSMGAIELVVRKVENSEPVSIGLDIEPDRQRSFYAHTKAMKMINRKYNKLNKKVDKDK